MMTGGQQATQDLLLVRSVPSAFGDRPLTVQFVAAVGDAPVPPGLDQVPAPGEVAASPALRAVLEGDRGGLLTERIPGTVAATIGEAGLLDPDELLAYVGKPAAELEAGSIRVTRFGGPKPDAPPLDPGLVLAIVFGSIGVLLPVIVFIWTATRLSATARETRLATLRLLGATPSTIRWLTAVEVGVVAALGCLGGVGLFLLGRWLVPWMGLLPAHLRLFTADIRPPLAEAALVLAAVPALAVAVAWLSLRRVVANPIGVVRRSKARSWTAVPGAVALTIGLAAWVWILTDRGFFDRSSRIVDGVALAGWVFTAIGVIGLAPWIGTRGAALVVRAGGVGSWLAARRLGFDRRSAARISVGVVAVVYAAGVTLGMLAATGDGEARGASAALSPTTLVGFSPPKGPRAMTRLRHVPGVESAVPIRHVSVRVPQQGTFAAALADCAALSDVVRHAPSCGSGPALAGVPRPAYAVVVPGTTVAIRAHGNVPPIVLTIPADAPPVDLAFDIYGGVMLLDTSVLPEREVTSLPPSEVLIATDGNPDTAERIREAFTGGRSFSVDGPSGMATWGWTREQAIAQGVRLAALVALAMAAGSLLVSLAGAINERRRPLAALAATGVPPSTLRRSYMVQAMAPLAAGVVLAVGCAALVVAATTSELQQPVWPDVAPAFGVGVLAIVLGAAATAATLPIIGRSIAPDSLHAE